MAFETPEVGRCGSIATRPNKGMKLTSVEPIGRSQLIPGVLRTIVGTRGGEPVSKVVGFGGTSCCLSRPS